MLISGNTRVLYFKRRTHVSVSPLAQETNLTHFPHWSETLNWSNSRKEAGTPPPPKVRGLSHCSWVALIRTGTEDWRCHRTGPWPHFGEASEWMQLTIFEKCCIRTHWGGVIQVFCDCQALHSWVVHSMAMHCILVTTACGVIPPRANCKTPRPPSLRISLRISLQISQRISLKISLCNLAKSQLQDTKATLSYDLSQRGGAGRE